MIGHNQRRTMGSWNAGVMESCMSMRLPQDDAMYWQRERASMSKQNQRGSMRSTKFAGKSRLEPAPAGPCGKAVAGHPLAQATFLEKRLFQLTALLVKQVICLVDHAQHNVRHYLSRASLDMSYRSHRTHFCASQASVQIWLHGCLSPKPGHAGSAENPGNLAATPPSSRDP